VKDVKVKKR